MSQEKKIDKQMPLQRLASTLPLPKGISFNLSKLGGIRARGLILSQFILKQLILRDAYLSTSEGKESVPFGSKIGIPFKAKSSSFKVRNRTH